MLTKPGNLLAIEHILGVRVMFTPYWVPRIFQPYCACEAAARRRNSVVKADLEIRERCLGNLLVNGCRSPEHEEH